MTTHEELVEKAKEYRDMIEEGRSKLANLLRSNNIKIDKINLNFFLTNKVGVNVRSVYCQNRKFIYSTPTLECNTPIYFIDIFNAAKPHLDKYVKEYKNYKMQNKQITNSTFKIIISYEEGRFKQYEKRKAYDIDIDNLKNEVIYEYKNNNLLENKEEIMSFYVNIEVELYNQNKFFQYDGEKDPIITDKCIICNKNKPNLLITKCFHLVVCRDCNMYNNLNECPRCNKPIAGIHKVLFVTLTK